MIQDTGIVKCEYETVPQASEWYCRSGEEQSHKSPTPSGAVVLMSTVEAVSLFSFILRTRLVYDVSTNLER